jgi:hypothetical protein
LSELDEITPSTRVVDIIKNFPELTEYFLKMGICGCGYTWESDYYWSIEKVAKEKGLDLKKLLDELNRMIQL